MAKRLLNNPTSKEVQVLHFAQIPEDVQEHIRKLEAEVIELKAKPPLVDEKIVEVEKIVQDPRLIEKHEKLKAQYDELKARGAYQLVKEALPPIEVLGEKESWPKVEQKAEIGDGEKEFNIFLLLGTASTVGFLFGIFVMWFFMKR